MILVDTSVWVDHFRRRQSRAATTRLVGMLEADDVLLHPWVLGELALGGLGAHPEILDDLRRLPPAPGLETCEILELVQSHTLFQTGIGWVEAHLLGSALIAGAHLWTYDDRSDAVARRLGAAWPSRPS